MHLYLAGVLDGTVSGEFEEIVARKLNSSFLISFYGISRKELIRKAKLIKSQDGGDGKASSKV